MKISFPYEEKLSGIFGKVRRPIAKVQIWSLKFSRFLEFTMLVDTGSDYTLLPKARAVDLGIDLEQDCRVYLSRGIGGEERVYFYKKRARIKIGDWERRIPIGFLSRDDIPPLLGREGCLNAFAVLFSKFKTTFSWTR